MIRPRSNYFYSSYIKKCYNFARFLSANLSKSAKQKVTLENKFIYGKYFQNCFRNATPKTTHVSKNSDSHGNRTQMANKEKVRYPVDFSYRGEILFGIHPVYLALKQQKRQFFQLFLKDEFMMDQGYSKRDLKLEVEYLAREMGINTRKVSNRYLNCLAPDAVHQGVCLDASAVPVLDCDETNFEFSGKSGSFPLWLLLDSVQDPMNFGAVIRSSYFFGVDRIITVRNNSCKLTPVVSKASSGAMEIMDIFYINDLKDFVQRKKWDGWLIVSTAVCDYGSLNYNDSNCNIVSLNQFSLRKPTILILGNEARGVSMEVQSLCDVLLSIHPKKDIFPCIDSLNVSVATGIILHHMKNLCELG